jgi:hypothetical protein
MMGSLTVLKKICTKVSDHAVAVLGSAFLGEVLKKALLARFVKLGTDKEAGYSIIMGRCLM